TALDSRLNGRDIGMTAGMADGAVQKIGQGHDGFPFSQMLNSPIQRSLRDKIGRRFLCFGRLSFRVVASLVKLHSDSSSGFPPLLVQFRAAERLGFLLAVRQIDALAQCMRRIVAGCAACSQVSRDAGAALTAELDLFTSDMG